LMRQLQTGGESLRLTQCAREGLCRLIDALLVVTALHYNLAVVSRNVSDFANTQVPFLNP
jgi:predicted nucleic acid-binding protein